MDIVGDLTEHKLFLIIKWTSCIHALRATLFFLIVQLGPTSYYYNFLLFLCHSMNFHSNWNY